MLQDLYHPCCIWGFVTGFSFFHFLHHTSCWGNSSSRRTLHFLSSGSSLCDYTRSSFFWAPSPAVPGQVIISEIPFIGSTWNWNPNPALLPRGCFPDRDSPFLPAGVHLFLWTVQLCIPAWSLLGRDDFYPARPPGNNPKVRSFCIKLLARPNSEAANNSWSLLVLLFVSPVSLNSLQYW